MTEGRIFSEDHLPKINHKSESVLTDEEYLLPEGSKVDQLATYALTKALIAGVKTTDFFKVLKEDLTTLPPSSFDSRTTGAGYHVDGYQKPESFMDDFKPDFTNFRNSRLDKDLEWLSKNAKPVGETVVILAISAAYIATHKLNDFIEDIAIKKDPFIGPHN